MHIFPVPFSAIHLMLEKAGNSAPNVAWHRKVGGYLHVGDFVEFEAVCFPSANVRKNILTADHYMHFTCGQILRILRCINADSDCETVKVLVNFYSFNFHLPITYQSASTAGIPSYLLLSRTRFCCVLGIKLVNDTDEAAKPECGVHFDDSVRLYNKYYVRHQVNVSAPFDCRVRVVPHADLSSSSSEVYHKLSDHFVSFPEAMTTSASQIRDKVLKLLSLTGEKQRTTNCIWLSVPRAVWRLLWRHVHNAAPIAGHQVVSDKRMLPMKKCMLKLNSDNIVDVSTSVFDYMGVKRGAENSKIWRSYVYTLEHIEMLQNVLGHFFGVGARFNNKAATENDLLNVITHLKRSA
jgi:hypothetical protein